MFTKFKKPPKFFYYKPTDESFTFEGYVYLVRRKSDGIYKIGKTKKSYWERFSSLSEKYGTIEVIAIWETSQVAEAEKIALEMTGPFAYIEKGHIELRKMRRWQVNEFIDNFTAIVKQLNVEPAAPVADATSYVEVGEKEVIWQVPREKGRQIFAIYGPIPEEETKRIVTLWNRGFTVEEINKELYPSDYPVDPFTIRGKQYGYTENGHWVRMALMREGLIPKPETLSQIPDDLRRIT